MASRDELIAQMAAATDEAEAATPTATLDAPAETNDLPDHGEETAAPAEKANGETAPDPWKEIQQKYTPERIKELEEDAKNHREMARQSHLRNEASSRERQTAESILKQAEEANQRANLALERDQQLVDAAAMLKASGNEDMANQFLDMAARMQSRSRRPAQAPEAPESGLTGGSAVEADLRKEIAELRKQTQQFSFAISHSAVVAAVNDAANQVPLLTKKYAKDLGIDAEVIEDAISDLYATSQQEINEGRPQSVNWTDRRSLAIAAQQAVKKRASRLEQLANFHLNDWRAERKAKNGQVPPSSKGPSASVRSVPNAAASPPRGSSKEQIAEFRAKQFLEGTPGAGKVAEEA